MLKDKLLGVNNAVETPVPISNTEVKHCSGEGIYFIVNKENSKMLSNLLNNF